MISQNMIEQFKSIIDDIEKSNESKSLQKALELAKFIYKNTIIDSEKIKLLKKDDIYLDSLLEIDGLATLVNTQLKIIITELDKELKGSDFEKGILENSSLLDDIKNEIITKKNQLKDLQQRQNEYNQIKNEIKDLDKEIAPYLEIDLPQIQKEIEIKKAQLKELEKTKGDDLKIFRLHFDESSRLGSEIEGLNKLSKEIEYKLNELDNQIKISIGEE